MITVSDATRRAYMTDGTHKDLIVMIPSQNITITNEHILQGSFSLDESVLSNTSLEFVGCISSKMEVTIENIYPNVKWKDLYIEVYMDIQPSKIDAGAVTNRVPLFKGYIDSAKKQANQRHRKIEAYDILYKLSEKDVTDWYNNGSQMSLTSLLGSICDHCGLQYYIPSPLINGNITAFRGTYKTVNNLSALDLLKQICQFNACFGRINRNGVFEVKYMALNRTLYPGSDVFPAADLYPAKPISEGDENFFNFYEEVEYEDFYVKPIEKVIIRNGSTEQGVSYGEGTNKYIVQNNIFAYNQNEQVLQACAQRILNRIGEVSFIPYTSKNNGLPYIECGDEVVYHDLTSLSTDKNIHFIVFDRTLSGDQMLRDSYKAEGDEYQTEFITDLSASLSDIDQRLDNLQDQINDIWDAMQDEGYCKIVSVQSVPAGAEQNVLYCVQGEFLMVVK